MASPKLTRGRSSDPGAYYAITTVVAGRHARFADPVLARLVVDGFRTAPGDGLAASLAWVVMPDHVHWLLQLRQGSLSCCVQRFKSCSARAVNAAGTTTGALWQAGFYDHRLRGEDDLRAQARYIVANPLRRGLAQRVEDYPFWWCRWISGSQDL